MRAREPHERAEFVTGLKNPESHVHTVPKWSPSQQLHRRFLLPPLSQSTMKVQHSLIPLLGSASVLASQQAPWGVKSLVSQAVGSFGLDGSVADAVGHFLAGKKPSKSAERVFEALDTNKDIRTFVEKDGITCTSFEKSEIAIRTKPFIPCSRPALHSPRLPPIPCPPQVSQAL